MVKFSRLNFLWANLPSIIFSCVNNPSTACKVVETLYLWCNFTLVPWLTLPPVFVHRQDPIETKIEYVWPNILPKTIEFYTDMPVVPVTNSMSMSIWWSNQYN